jgi:hypothetical protein
MEESSFPETVRFTITIANLEYKYQAIPFLFQVGFGRILTQGDSGYQQDALKRFLKRNPI